MAIIFCIEIDSARGDFDGRLLHDTSWTTVLQEQNINECARISPRNSMTASSQPYSSKLLLFSDLSSHRGMHRTGLGGKFLDRNSFSLQVIILNIKVSKCIYSYQ